MLYLLVLLIGASIGFATARRIYLVRPPVVLPEIEVIDFFYNQNFGSEMTYFGYELEASQRWHFIDELDSHEIQPFPLPDDDWLKPVWKSDEPLSEQPEWKMMEASKKAMERNPVVPNIPDNYSKEAYAERVRNGTFNPSCLNPESDIAKYLISLGLMDAPKKAKNRWSRDGKNSRDWARSRKLSPPPPPVFNDENVDESYLDYIMNS